MSEAKRHDLIRSDSVTNSAIMETKSFVYTWTINNFPLLYNNKRGRIAPKYEDLSETTSELWNNVYMEFGKVRDPDNLIKPLGLQFSFDTTRAKITYDICIIVACIIDKNNKERNVVKIDRYSDAIVSYYNDNFTNKLDLLDEKEGLLRDGSLTIKIELVFTIVKLTQVNLSYTDPAKLQSSADKQKLTAIRGMLNDERFSDAKIIVDGKVFHVHKFILATQSTVLAAMFEHDMRESKVNAIEIGNFDQKTVGEMLRFIYTGRVNDLDVTARDLLAAADMYNLELLKVLCEEALIEALNVESASGLLVLAGKYKAERLKKKAMAYFKSRQEEIVKSKTFKEDYDSLAYFVPDILIAYSM